MTSTTSFTRLARLLSALGLCLSTACAHAAYPEKAITIVVPFTAGGSSDAITRSLAEGMSARLKVPVLVENRTGANTLVGLEHVARSPADGYTLFLHQTTTATMPVMSKDMRVDPLKVLTSVGICATSEVWLVGTGKMPAKNWAEFVAYAKANPGTASYGFAGGYLQLLVEYMMKRDKVDAVPIAFKGSADLQQALMAGTVSAGITILPNAQTFLKDGRLRVLAVTGSKRLSTMPDVQTISEAGFPEARAENITFWGVSAPTGTPKAVLDQLNAALVDAVKQPAYAQRLAAFDAQPTSSSPEQMNEFAQGTVRLWTEIAQKVGFKPE